MKVLVCTFGYSADKILAAVKHLPAPRLVLVTSQENLQRPGYEELAEIMRDLGVEMSVCLVDKFDFMDGLEKVSRLLDDLKKDKHEVVMNISGGVPLLSDAAILAAFHAGVPAYYVDERNVRIRLPVLKDVKTGPKLNRDESRALLAVKNGTDFRSVDVGDGPWGIRARKAMLSLKAQEFIRTEGTTCFLTQSGEVTADWIRRCQRS
jgi:hypothetical protein